MHSNFAGDCNWNDLLNLTAEFLLISSLVKVIQYTTHIACINKRLTQTLNVH